MARTLTRRKLQTMLTIVQLLQKRDQPIPGFTVTSTMEVRGHYSTSRTEIVFSFLYLKVEMEDGLEV